VDIEPRIEGFAEGIVSTVVAENTLFERQVNLCRVIRGYHIANRNLRLDYSASHNWSKWGQQALLERQELSMRACFDHSSYRTPFLLGSQHDMQYRSV
jgi:hypothetical protein